MARVKASPTHTGTDSPTEIDDLKRAAVALRLAILQEERAAYFNLGQMLAGSIVLQSPEEIARGVAEKQRRLDELRQEIWGVDPSWE